MMKRALIDSSVILDIFTDDPRWYNWSAGVLDHHAESHQLCINSVIYAEVSIGFKEIEVFEKSLLECGFKLLEIPKEALFLAGKAFLRYKKQKGTKVMPLPDFFIGAHAAVTGMTLITRDVKRIKPYFPKVSTVSPSQSKMPT
jgi:predicted nucleic acid-binding protein